MGLFVAIPGANLGEGRRRSHISPGPELISEPAGPDVHGILRSGASVDAGEGGIFQPRLDRDRER